MPHGNPDLFLCPMSENRGKTSFLRIQFVMHSSHLILLTVVPKEVPESHCKFLHIFFNLLVLSSYKHKQIKAKYLLII